MIMKFSASAHQLKYMRNQNKLQVLTSSKNRLLFLLYMFTLYQYLKLPSLDL
jgi:hypothetical protein